MSLHLVKHLIFCCSLVIGAVVPSWGQGKSEEEGEGGALTYRYGTRYVETNVRSLDKYAERYKRQQTRMLTRLAGKERRLLHRLKRTDSAAYARLQSDQLSFDSLSRLSGSDSNALAQGGMAASGTVDSLKRIYGFVQNKTDRFSAVVPGMEDYSRKLDALGNELSYRRQLDKLAAERMASLKAAASSKIGSLPGLKTMEKTVFYTKARVGAFKEIASNPSKLEEKALEYLQGAAGFDQAMKEPVLPASSATTSAGNALPSSGGSAPTTADMERMGYQTKRSLQGHLRSNFGGQLSGVQQQVSGQVGNYQQKLANVSNQVQQTAHAVRGLQSTAKPSFRVNPMRGLPFLQRLEKGYSFQTSQPSDGHPALLDLGGFAGFKHTARLSYGAGLVLSTGLGQGWNDIRLSLEGAGVRTYLKWEWLYGIAAYGGYERTYNKNVFADNGNSGSAFENDDRRGVSRTYRDNLLLGAQKSYRINANWSGAFQVLFDVNWRAKGLTSPLVFRMNAIQ